MKMNKLSTLDLLDGIECIGCLSCYNSCPTGAIKTVSREDGFSYPSIESSKCIGCHSCINSCPERLKISKNIPLECYSCYAKKESFVLQGSSGGVIPLLADYVISRGGVLFGAVFDNETSSIIHTSSDKVAVDKIFRSKYVQSNIGSSYKEVKSLLDENSLVMFTGSPCQIAGLKAFLNKDYENLILVDFICHGVPSPGVFKNILANHEKKRRCKIREVSFREKDYGWVNQTIKLYYEDNTVEFKKSKLSTFYNLFVFNYILRKSCYNCKYQDTPSGDITVADDWTFKKNVKGASKVYLNSRKGVETFSRIKEAVSFEKSAQAAFPPRKKYNTKGRTSFYKSYKPDKSNRLVFRRFFLRCCLLRTYNKLIKVLGR